MKPSFLLFVLIFIFLSCKKTEIVKMDLKCPVVAVKGSDTNVIGKWKLVKGVTVFADRRTEDYSCNEVIYTFKTNETLTISSDTKDLISLSPGEYSYNFPLSPFYEDVKESYTMQINQSELACTISNGVMVLDGSSLDGPIQYFVRI